MSTSTAAVGVAVAAAVLVGPAVLALALVAARFAAAGYYFPARVQRAVRGKHVLVAGASKGLGRALAIELARQGAAKITLLARGRDALDDTAAAVRAAARSAHARVGGDGVDAAAAAAVTAVSVDLADQAATLRAYGQIVAEQGQPHWLFLIAGSSRPDYLINTLEPPSTTDVDYAQSLLTSNLATTTNVVRAALLASKASSPSVASAAGVTGQLAIDAVPVMTADEQDAAGFVAGIPRDCTVPLPERIIFCGSMLSFFSFVGYVTYSASKYAIRGFQEALRSELRPLGVKVHMYYPGNIDSPGHVIENKTKPALTRKIDGASNPESSESVARWLLAGIVNERLSINNELIGELIRVVNNGTVPRPNPVTEMFAVGLIAAILDTWRFLTDMDVAAFYRKAADRKKL
ncbi:3-dehydrosphinganine reductase [Cladochytrium tenue]|nr:3-dehydrosphinganine reductase [Cladochytrium tenue]